MAKKIALVMALVALLASCATTKQQSVAQDFDSLTRNATVKTLALGEVTVYDFGDIKLHAYKSNDALADENYAFENANAIVILESSAFKAQVQEWANYVNSLGKPLAGSLMAYHPNGWNAYNSLRPYATQNALENWSEGGSIRALVDGFVVAFGDAIDTNMPSQINAVNFGESRTIGGMTFTFINAGDDAYSVEIPEINVVYRHMMGSTCHNILTSIAHIDAEIAAMRQYQQRGYALILTSHFVPEGQAAVAQKISYLETVKSLAQTCGTKDDFLAQAKNAFPNYSGENYLEMTAGFLYQ